MIFVSWLACDRSTRLRVSDIFIESCLLTVYCDSNNKMNCTAQAEATEKHANPCSCQRAVCEFILYGVTQCYHA